MTDGPTATAGGSDELPRYRLARLIAARRRQLGMSLTEAADRAGVARNTWTTAESGSRSLRDQNFLGIERALAWAPGSIDKILNGGEPAAMEQRTPAARAGLRADFTNGLRPDFEVVVEVERIRHLNLPAEARLRLIREVLDLYEELARESVTDLEPRDGGASPPS